MLSLMLAVLLPTADAASCDSWLAQVGTAKGAALVDAFKGLAKCDASVAKAEVGRFMRASGDLETLIPMTIAGIDAGAYDGVWNTMSKVPYEHRDALAKAVGEACASHPNVLPFIQGAYVGLKGTEFTSWQPVLITCAKAELTTWVESVVTDPPVSEYNDKYNAIITAYAKAKGVDALPALEKAAVKAASNQGPFNNIIETFQRAIQPKRAADAVTPEATQKMEEALVRVAKAVSPDKARLVADRLVNTGNEALAASLLPAVFPDRVQSDGGMLWAAAAVESCDGQAVIHWASWSEAPKRWSVVEAGTAALRATKAKLKCDGGVWPVAVTQEPLANRAAGEAWYEALEAEWEAKGVKVKASEEKVTVP